MSAVAPSRRSLPSTPEVTHCRRRRITLAFGSVTDSRVIRVAPTNGSASLQIVNADPEGPLQFRSNSGRSTIPLGFGAVHEQMIAAGTLFVTAEGV